MKTYTFHKGWVIAIMILFPALMLLFCALPFFVREDQPLSWLLQGYNWLIPVACLLIVLVLVLGMIDAVKGKFVIDNDRVYSVHPFSYRELLFHQIKGFRVDDNYIHIIPQMPDQKKIRVSKYYKGYMEVIEWLVTRYDDLDVVVSTKEYNEIVGNQEYGFTEAEREQKLKAAKGLARKLNIAGGLIGVWLWFFPQPYTLAILVAIFFPVITGLFMRQQQGLLRMEVKEKTAYAKLNFAFLGPAFGLFLTSLSGFNILDHTNLWAPALLLTGALTALALYGKKFFSVNKKTDYLIILLVVILFFTYGYGTIVAINCGFDKTAPETHKTEVLKKRISGSKTKSYYLEVRSDDPSQDFIELQVPYSFYTSLSEGDEVFLEYRPGLLNARWVNVRNTEGAVSAINSHGFR